MRKFGANLFRFHISILFQIVFITALRHRDRREVDQWMNDAGWSGRFSSVGLLGPD